MQPQHYAGKGGHPGYGYYGRNPYGGPHGYNNGYYGAGYGGGYGQGYYGHPGYAPAAGYQRKLSISPVRKSIKY